MTNDLYDDVTLFLLPCCELEAEMPRTVTYGRSSAHTVDAPARECITGAAVARPGRYTMLTSPAPHSENKMRQIPCVRV
jgi:hypothetical protein